MALAAAVPAGGPRSPRSRRLWLPDLLILALLMTATTLIFWLTPLDQEVARWFFQPQGDRAWPLGRQNPWVAINRRGDFVLAVLLIGGSLGVLAAGFFATRWQRWRRYALFVLATILLGPGLLVNGVFKEHWGRPRPVQTLDFQGTHAYIPPLQMGPLGGNSSFPSGHASIAFSYVVFWFLWRRGKPRLAGLALAGAGTLGGVMGFARMAGGAHYLSDILWAGYLTYLSALIPYHFILRIPQIEDPP